MPSTPAGLMRRAMEWGCIALLAAGCHGPYGSPSPRLPGLPRAEVPGVLKYGASLPYRTRLGASARQILAADTPAVGPREVIVKLEPELNSWRLTEGQLAEGSVIARFHKESDGALRRFGLAESDTESFWIVYRKGDAYMGRFVSASMDTTYAIRFETHDSAEKGMKENLPWAQAIAQFEYLGTTVERNSKQRGDGFPTFSIEGGGGTAWVSCTILGCCRSQ